MYVESGYERGSKLRVNPILCKQHKSSSFNSLISSHEGFVHRGRLRMQKEHQALPIFLDVAQRE